MKRRCAIGLTLLTLLLNTADTFPNGTVYLVLGSDTAIWEGLDVSQYNCTIIPGLFSDPSRNAARVMDPAFRNSMTDSYGTPLKLTWWMMAGNMFRHATNTNVPFPNTMTTYLMKKHNGQAIRQWGDELTLHYHTYVWSDYDGDGRWFWNQSPTFAESADDFNQTLAALLLEEEIFPVSFRSGWHYMDNGWQQRIDSILPYSLHNDWPGVHRDTVEPIDNNYDWSHAPSRFVPFHPSPDDYQIPGSCRGWNVRSEYMTSMNAEHMSQVFAAANTGVDQVACIWAHLPESDFPENIQNVHAAVLAAAQNYPDVTFRYCTAVEAMQRWRGCADTTRPHIVLEETGMDEYPEWRIETDEPIFQFGPFVAIKDRNEAFYLPAPTPLSGNSWQVTSPVARAQIAKVGVAVTDTSGNYSTALLRYLPDDIILDNGESGYVEVSGQWTSSPVASWGTSGRQSVLGPEDSATVRWTVSVPSTHLFNIFIQIPEVANPAQQILFRFIDGSTVGDSVSVATGLPPNRWNYLGTRLLSDSLMHTVEMKAYGSVQAGTVLTADAVKFSAMVREKWLVVPELIDGGIIVVNVPSQRQTTIRNGGIQPVQITAAYSIGGTVHATDPFPLVVPPMGQVPVDLMFETHQHGSLDDTLVVTSDDPAHAEVRVPVHADVREFFRIVDDADSAGYQEWGSWNTSVAQAYGPSSRYAYPAAGVAASFSFQVPLGGQYEVREIVPTTVNASTRAKYILRIDGNDVDSVFVDQNQGSGDWVAIMTDYLPAESDVDLVVTDAMVPPEPGRVLRADAVMFQMLRDTVAGAQSDPEIPLTNSLRQNYPNPFNPSTIIRYQLSMDNYVSLGVYDLLGREVAVLVHEKKIPGSYTVTFDASGLASGVYLYRLVAGEFIQTRKMVLIH